MIGGIRGRLFERCFVVPGLSMPRSASAFDGSRRNKHSSAQVKRLFKKNPARLRVEERLGVDRSSQALPPPRFQPIFEPELLPNGWSTLAGPEVPRPDYPFRVDRTKNKPQDAVGFLPVYAKCRKDGTKVTTRIKKVSGDRELFLEELRSVLSLPAPRNENPRDDTIQLRTGGTVEVSGNRVREVKAWLSGLGF